MSVSNKYTKHMTEHRRLCILRILNETGGTANDSVLDTTLDAFGFPQSTRDDLRNDIRFLKDNGLVVDEWVGTLLVVTITRRGVDVAKGRTTIEGVQPPSIGV